MELTNREWAIVLWTAIVLTYAFSKAKLWAQLMKLLKMAFNKQIRILFGSMGLYAAGCVWLLWYLGMWGIDNLKTTLMWIVGFAVVSLFQIGDAEKDEGHFRKLAKESIGVNMIIAFVASTYVFGFFVEFVLVPIAGVATFAVAYADGKDEFATVRKLFYGILVLIGFAYMMNALYQIWVDFWSLASTATLAEFSIPVLLTLLYIPFLFAWHVFLSYERVPFRLKYTIKDELVNKYARRQALLGFKWDTKGLRRWLRHVALFRPETTDAVDASIAEIKKARRRDRKPFRVPPDDGWLPEHAKQFLTEEGLVVGDYSRSYDGWHANSPYLPLGKRANDNNIAYYIEGDEWTVRSLRLVLNVNYPEDSESATASFREKVSRLVNLSAYGKKGESREIGLDINGASVEVGRISVNLKKKEWNNKTEGYELVLNIVPIVQPA